MFWTKLAKEDVFFFIEQKKKMSTFNSLIQTSLGIKLLLKQATSFCRTKFVQTIILYLKKKKNEHYHLILHF